MLQLRQMLEERLHLPDHHFEALLSVGGIGEGLHLLAGRDQELQFFYQLRGCLHVDVGFGLLRQRDLENDRVELRDVKGALLRAHHLLTLLVEELPHARNRLQVLLGHLVEVPLRGAQFFLVLLLHHLEVKPKEPLDLGPVLQLQLVEAPVQLLQKLQQPVVQLGPLSGKVVLDEYRYDERELVVGIFCENNGVWVHD